MKKWRVERFKYPLNKLYQSNFRIVEDDGVQFPVCYLPCSISEQQSRELLERQNEYANLLNASPVMLEALEMALYFMDKNNEAYEVVEDAIKLAKNGTDEQYSPI